MPVTSKHVVSFIAGLNGDFTRRDITAELTRHHVGPPKGGRKSHSPERIAAIIDRTLEELTDAGLLKKKRNTYSKAIPFLFEGRIRITGRGNGIVRLPDDDEIHVSAASSAGAHNNDLVRGSITGARKGVIQGAVDAIIERSRTSYFARVIHGTRDSVIYALMDAPGNREACSARNDGSPVPRVGDIAMVRLEEDAYRGRQRCSVISTFSPDDESYDLERVFIKHGVPGPHGNYPELDEPPELDEKKRKSYAHLFTITIDGKDAKDFDDAISLEKNRSGFTLYVHIADVSAYVRKGSPLDREALSRGTSYYLGNAVVPMIPEQLSNDLCSLREGTDRLSMTVEIDIDRHGSVRDRRFHRGVILVDHRLTYESADALIRGPEKGTLRVALDDMYQLASVLNARRLREGSLELNLTDQSLVYENNVVTDIKYIERLKSHLIIEEFMLSANVVVSRALRESGRPSLYRNHDEVSPDSLLLLRDFLRQLGIAFRASGNTTASIQHVLELVKGKDIEHVVNLVILKSLMQANYGVTPDGHFGLGFRDYTHFTSPIRRYPDLVVHRCLKALIDGSPSPYAPEELAVIAEKSSETERIAQAAERDFRRIKSCRLMKGRVGEEFTGIVSGVSRYGFYVTLKDIPVEGMVPLRALTDDYYLVMEDDFTVIGKRHGKRFRMGDSVRVKLTGVEIERMIIDFEPA